VASLLPTPDVWVDTVDELDDLDNDIDAPDVTD
jgi:hypothetical protein